MNQYYKMTQAKNYSMQYLDANHYYMNDLSDTDQSQFSPTDWNSLLIHSVPDDYYNVIDLTKLLEQNLGFGKVSRIELVEKPIHEGEILNSRYSAFVYFEYWFQNVNVMHLRETINKFSQCDVAGYISGTILVKRRTFCDDIVGKLYIRFSRNPASDAIIQQQQQQSKQSEKPTIVGTDVPENIPVSDNLCIDLEKRIKCLENKVHVLLSLMAQILSKEELEESGIYGYGDELKEITNELPTDVEQCSIIHNDHLPVDSDEETYEETYIKNMRANHAAFMDLKYNTTEW